MEEKDKLEKFIADNRAEFDFGVSMPEGHLERFLQRLPSDEAKKKRSNLNRRIIVLLSAAARVALLLMVTNMFWLSTGDITAVDMNRVANTDEAIEREMSELHGFYTMKVESLVAQINKVGKECSTPSCRRIVEDSENIVVGMKAFEEYELQTLPKNEKGLYALNSHYTKTISGLDRLLYELEREN